MIRTSTLIIFMTFGVFMLYGGCNGDGGGVVAGGDMMDVELPPAPVPQTGQTKCWDKNGNLIDCDGTGQDGDIQAGVVPPDPRFTDNEDGTITDNLTGLVWLKDWDCVLGGSSFWEDASSQVNIDLKDGICGLADGSEMGDWHVPNVNELYSLFDFSYFRPVLPAGHPFINVRDNFYWTSTTAAFPDFITNVQSIAWNINVAGGTSAGGNKQTSRLVTAVRLAFEPPTKEPPAPVPQTGQTTCWDTNGFVIVCEGTGQDGDIRAGVVAPNPRFTDNGDGSITDNLTGLLWLKDWDCDSLNPATWENALFDVHNILRSGICGLTDGSEMGDWRVPNVNEFRSLLNFQNRTALPLNHPFINVRTDFYWTSTTAPVRPEIALTLIDGAVVGQKKTNTKLVTAVRDP